MSKTALITGASRGIGRATAVRLAEDGWRVAIGYHRSEAAARELERLLTANGADACAIGGDVSRADEAARLVAAAEQRFGHIDALINNAGVASFGLATDLSPDEWERLIAVNLSGAFYCCRAALPAMIRRQSGCIVQVSSMWGQTGGSCEVAYSAAKAGLIGLTKALAKEVGPSGIRVNCVAPGVIDTDMNAHLDEDTRRALAEETPLGRIGTPREAADAIAFLVSDAASFITGQVLSPNGGIYM